MGNSRSINVYQCPATDSSNPYFALLADALTRTGRVSIQTLPRGGLAALAAEPRSFSDTLVIIHWSTILYGSHYAIKSLALLAMNGAALLLLRLRGATIFWVMHNAYAHDYPHPHIDRLGRAFMRALASTVVVQQRATEDRFLRTYPRTAVAYIPHGNYIGAYGPRAAVRQTDDAVFLSFGMLRPYKGLEHIIDAFVTAGPEMSQGARLLVVGKGSEAYASALRARVPKHSRVIIENRFVPDRDITKLFASARYSVFWYDDSELTSGGVILALSYGVPVIARDTPTIEMAQEGIAGFRYGTEAELAARFVELARAPRPDPERVVESVRADTWDRVAQTYIARYDSLHGTVS